MKKRVLFVDDDPAILSSMRQLFRRERDRWDMVFALGGHAGLVELAAGPFDIVVSDMRMPGVTGAALLREVTERYPGTLRILLSGGGDPQLVAEAMDYTDHVLEKPCPRDLLRDTIDGRGGSPQSKSTQTSSPTIVTG